MLNAIQKAAVRHCVAYELSPPDSRLDHQDWCTQVGINRKTLSRWREDPEFESAVEAQRTALEESSDPYALIARTVALEQLMSMLGSQKLTVTERRMVVKDIMEMTKHVDDTGVPVDYSDMTDEDLLNAILNRDLTPLGMTEAQLKRLAKGESCTTSSQGVSPEESSSPSDSPSDSKRRASSRKKRSANPS